MSLARVAVNSQIAIPRSYVPYNVEMDVAVLAPRGEVYPRLRDAHVCVCVHIYKCVRQRFSARLPGADYARTCNRRVGIGEARARIDQAINRCAPVNENYPRYSSISDVKSARAYERERERALRYGVRSNLHLVFVRASFPRERPDVGRKFRLQFERFGSCEEIPGTTSTA